MNELFYFLALLKGNGSLIIAIGGRKSEKKKELGHVKMIYEFQIKKGRRNETIIDLISYSRYEPWGRVMD